jgi:predicted ribosomally synthesized peptide with SipW-like signal peptide
MAAFVLVGWGLGPDVLAIFTSTKTVSSNTVSTGTISLTDNDGGTAMLSLNNAKPGDRDTACINVTYTGSLPASVRMYDTVSGTGLEGYVDLTVTRGTISSGAFDSCTNFTPDNYNYNFYWPVGVEYQGSLAAYPTTYSSAIVDLDTTGATETWTTNEVHAYKFQVTVGDVNAAAGKNVTVDFTFEAR